MLRAHCDVVLKVIERERGEGRGEKWRGGVARRRRVTHLATTQQRAERAQREQRATKSEVSVGQRSEHCEGGLKEKYRGILEG